MEKMPTNETEYNNYIHVDDHTEEKSLAIQNYSGKQKSDGTWVYGDLIKNSGKMYIRPQNNRFEVSPCDGAVQMFSAHEIITDTLSLGCGKKDVNKKNIFSGHILKNKDGVLFLVQYGSFAMYCPVDQAMMENIGFVVTSPHVPGDMPLGPTEEWATIVGNVFDNPEMLEQKNHDEIC